MEDKYSLFIKYSKRLDEKSIDSFFENIILNNKKIFVPNFVRTSIQIINKDENVYNVDSKIFDLINNHVREQRNNLKKYIRNKSESNIVDLLIKILKDFGIMIYQIKPFFQKDINVKLYESLLTSLLCDPFLKKILEKDIMDNSKFYQVKFFINKIKGYEIYKSWFIPFLEICISSKIKSIFVKISKPNNYDSTCSVNELIKNEIRCFTNFSKLVDFYNKYSYHFSYLKDNNIFKYFNTTITNTIHDISMYSSIVTLNEFLIENHKNLNKIGNTFTPDEKLTLEANIVIHTDNNINHKISLKNICEFYITLSKYFSKTFTTICKLYCQKISRLIHSRNLYDEFNKFIIEKVSEVNGTSSKSKNYDISKDCDLYYVVEIIKNLSNKDIVFRNFHNYQMLRLSSMFLEYSKSKELNNSKVFIDFEKNMNKIINKCFNNYQKYLLVNTVNDIEESIFFNKIINEDFSKSVAATNSNYNNSIEKCMEVLMTSSNIWDLKIFSNSIKCDTEKLNKLRETDYSLIFNIFKITSVYEAIGSHEKTLNWYLHLGHIKFSFNSSSRKNKLIVLPIQYLILERVLKNYEMAFEELIDYPIIDEIGKNKIKGILDSLLNNKILVISNDMYRINYNFSGDLDLTKESTNFNSNPKDSIDINNKEESLKNDINDIVKANINSIIKPKDISLLDCYKKCSMNLEFIDSFYNNVSLQDNNIFIKAFEELKVKEYLQAYKIEIESENIEKKVNVEEINFSESNDLSSIYLSKILF